MSTRQEQVARAIDMMHRLGYPSGMEDVVVPVHKTIGAESGDLGATIGDWLGLMPDPQMDTVLTKLRAEMSAKAKVLHPARSSATGGGGGSIIDKVPGVPLEVLPMVHADLGVIRPNAAALQAVDELIASVKDRTLVPTSEIIDQLLDIRIGLSSSSEDTP